MCSALLRGDAECDRTESATGLVWEGAGAEGPTSIRTDNGLGCVMVVVYGVQYLKRDENVTIARARQSRRVYPTYGDWQPATEKRGFPRPTRGLLRSTFSPLQVLVQLKSSWAYTVE